MTIQIGPITLAGPVILAPMSGVSDLPFRRLVKRAGCGLVVSEMIASQAMIRENRQTLRMVETEPEEFPMAVQLAGCEPEVMAEAAKLNQDRGAAVVDINFGCPVKKVVNGHAGSSLMRDEALAGRILEAVRAVQPLPAALDTVFTSHLAAVLRTLARDGRGVAWLPESLIAEDLARGTLVRAGVPAGDERWTVPVQIRLVRPRARQSKAAESFWTLAVEAALWRNAESTAEASAPVAGAEPVAEKEL